MKRKLSERARAGRPRVSGPVAQSKLSPWVLYELGLGPEPKRRKPSFWSTRNGAQLIVCGPVFLVWLSAVVFNFLR